MEYLSSKWIYSFNSFLFTTFFYYFLTVKFNGIKLKIEYTTERHEKNKYYTIVVCNIKRLTIHDAIIIKV